MNLGKRIHAIRKIKKMTLKEFASKVNLSISYLSDIENGRRNPSLARLRDIATALDTTVNYLLTGEEPTGNTITASEHILYEQFLLLMQDVDTRNIVSEILDIRNWSKRDKNELFSYLKIKHNLREHVHA